MKIRILTAALLGSAALLGVTAPLKAQSSGTNVAAAEPAVPGTPRQPTPAALAAPQLGSPDASKIDATDGKGDEPDSGKADDNADGIVATVNDEAISEYELHQRIGLVVATSGQPPPTSPEDMKRLRTISLEQLEDETIERQEAVKKHITVSPADTDKTINRMITDNKMTIDQLRSILTNAGTNEAALRAKIAADLAWQKAVQDEYGDRPIVTPAQVDAEMQRFAEGANKPHYLVGEIFLAVDNPNQDAKVQQDAQALVTQLQQGAPFALVAHQFSQDPSAAVGGEIGLVREGQLKPELDSALRNMKPGAISDPIRAGGGYYILALHERQEPLGTRIAAPTAAATTTPGTLKLVRLLLPLGDAPTKEIVEGAMKIAAKIRAGYDGCEKLAKTNTNEIAIGKFNVNGQMVNRPVSGIFTDMGETKLTDLNEDVQKALAQTPPGEMAPPLMSEVGIELIGRCDPKIEVRTAYTMPTRDQVQQELYEEQIAALARRYKRDLKRDANVEIR